MAASGTTVSNRYLYLGIIFITLMVLGVSIFSCESPKPPTYFPVQKEPAEAIMLALLPGELKMYDNGYLRVGGELIIWSYGYSWKIEGKEIWIIDDKGQSVAQVGDRIKMAGGQVPKYWAEEKIGSPLPEDAVGPYWLAGGPLEKLE